MADNGQYNKPLVANDQPQAYQGYGQNININMQQPNYQQQGYDQQQGYVQQPGYDQQQGYVQQPGYVQQQGYVQQPQPGTQGQIPLQPIPLQPIPLQPVTAMAGTNYSFTDKPLETLNTAISARIVQHLAVLELLTGCETKNRYSVYITDTFGVQHLLFKCKEDSSWCSRNCCYADVRPFIMKVKHVTLANQNSDSFADSFAQFNKPFKCTCWCCNRPEMKGSFRDSGEPFGKVIEPFRCCFSPFFYVIGQDNTVKYTIYLDCCQCGFYCRHNFCGKLAGATMIVYEGKTRSFHGQGIATIKKERGGLKELISDADSYNITFPSDATPEDKMMLIGAVLMIDYRYYEEGPCERADKEKKR